MHPNTLEVNWEDPSYPEGCMTWPLSDDCGEQWEAWLWACDDCWSEECEESVIEWFSQDAEFLVPQKPSDGCAVDPMEMPDTCWAEWDTLWNQCMGETEEGPYEWTDDCDMILAFTDAWTIWYDMEEDW